MGKRTDFGGINMNYIANKLHKNRDEILRFCNRHKEIHIFGAGIVGSLILRYFIEEKIKISDILVSPGHDNMNMFHGYPVKVIKRDEWTDGDGIVVAVSNKFRSEVLALLCQLNIRKDDIYIQNIYPSSFEEPLIKDALLLVGENENNGFFSKYKKLDFLGKKNNTDKCSFQHNYLNKYEFFFKELKDEPIRILELGVFNGSSLSTWADYFTKAQIYGVDIEEACSHYVHDRCQVILQDLGDEELFKELYFIEPSIIVDDASHYTSHQIKALYHLLPMLKTGGIYIIEDLGTNFNLYKNHGYQDAIVSCYEFCKAITDVVTSGEFLNLDKLHPSCVPLKKEIEFLAGQIEMISFIYESCIIIKR